MLRELILVCGLGVAAAWFPTAPALRLTTAVPALQPKSTTPMTRLRGGADAKMTLANYAGDAAAPALRLKATTPMTRLRGGADAKMTLANYAGDAARLFNNMVTPASIIAGALVPLGYIVPLPSPRAEGEPVFVAILRKLHLVIATASLCSELLSVMWATVAVNKLTEAAVAPAISTWALIQRDFQLPWLAVNAHFVLGMLGFMSMIATRAYLSAAGTPFGLGAAGFASSGLLLMMSVVNRGVASGGGEGQRYGGSALALVARYAVLLLRQALFHVGPLEILSILLGCASLGVVAAGVVSECRKR